MPSPPLRPRRRWPRVLAGGSVLAATLVLGLLLIPAIQGWLLRRMVATQSGWRLDFDRIGVGPTGVDASNLEFAMPGVAAHSEPVSVRVAPLRLFSHHQLLIERVEAHKIRLTIIPAQLSASPPFHGVLHWLQAPLSWALSAAQLEGEIVVQDAGETRLTGSFSLQGGGFAPDAPGEFTYSLTANPAIHPSGVDLGISSAGTLRLTSTSTHGIGGILLSGDLHSAPGGPSALPPGRITAEVTATPRGERYVAHLTFGTALTLDAEATLDAGRSILTGQVTFQADPSLAVALHHGPLPRLTAAGTLAFSENLRSGDSDATLTGDFTGSDWQILLPSLSALESLHGHLAAAIARRGDQISLTHFTASAAAEHSPANLTLTLTQPCALKKGPVEAVAKVEFSRWPIAWTNPLLAPLGLEAADGEFSAAGTVALDRTGAARFTPDRPATVERLIVQRGKSPPLPSWNIRFLPQVDVSASRMALTLDKIRADSAQGDRVDGHLAVSRETAVGDIHTQGDFQGSLPTVFAGPNRTLPFALELAWDAALQGARLHLATLDLTARARAETAPALEATLLRPLDLDWQKLQILPPSSVSTSPPPSPPAPSDWLRLRFAHFPLAWISRWLPGRTVEGTLVAGESRLGPAPNGGMAWGTSSAWQIQGLSLGLVAAPAPKLFAARLSPQATLNNGQIALRVADLAVSDESGNRLSGHVAAASELAKPGLTAEVALEADLPALPHSQGTFGALQAHLQAKIHQVAPRIMGADQFDLNLHTSSNEVLTLNSPLPFLFGLSGSDWVVVTTLAPLRLKIDRFPLSWLRPWTGGVALGGLVSPAELSLSARMNVFSVKSVAPWSVTGFSVQQGAKELVEDASATFTPGLDLTLIAVTRPTFQLAYTGLAQVAGVQVSSGVRPALNLDLGLGFTGDDKVVYPQRIALKSRVDLSALPTAAALGLPPQGILTVGIAGDLLGGKPMQASARLEGLPAARAGDTLPPVEATLHGSISKDNIISGGVELLLAATPRATDARFDVRLNLIDGGLAINSGFHSQFIDGAALLALARAFPASSGHPLSAVHSASAVLPVKPSLKAPNHLPFWGDLSGSFDLDIGTLQFAPYQIDHLRGRLEAGPEELALRDLSGDMFAGRWGGTVRILPTPLSATGEHTLAADFSIEQVESARVVQAVFPQQLPSIDARLNVHAHVASQGNSLASLIDRSTADFSVDGEKGVVRLTVPKEELLSTAAVFGGTVLLSPELRALGRLMKTFAEMPVDQLHIAGRRAADGGLTLDQFVLDSREAQVRGQGSVSADEAQPLMNRRLNLSLELAAKDDLAVILGGMNLLEKKPQGNGFRAMRRPFSLGGRVGTPDTASLYDLLARAVAGSKGTWSLLMHKLQAEIVKMKPSARPSSVPAALETK